MKKTIFCLLLVMAILLGLAGCGTTTKKKTTVTATPSAGQSAQSSTGKNNTASSESGLKQDTDTDLRDDLADTDALDPENGKSQVNEDGVLEDGKDMTEKTDKTVTDQTDTAKEKTKVVTKSTTR